MILIILFYYHLSYLYVEWSYLSLPHLQTEWRQKSTERASIVVGSLAVFCRESETWIWSMMIIIKLVVKISLMIVMIVSMIWTRRKSDDFECSWPSFWRPIGKVWWEHGLWPHDAPGVEEPEKNYHDHDASGVGEPGKEEYRHDDHLEQR